MAMSKPTGVERIAVERQRQIEAEDWTPEHDDAHTQGELAGMASWYAQPFAEWRAVMPTPSRWTRKPGDRIRELEKAGALIAAEIDRLLRAEGESWFCPDCDTHFDAHPGEAHPNARSIR